MRRLAFLWPEALEWQDVPEPEIEEPGQAVVAPIAVATSDLDTAIVHGEVPLQGPFAFGREFVAEVVSVGRRVRHFQPRDRVIVPGQISCGECRRCRRGLTASCESVPERSSYGLGAIGGEWGGALSDLVRVPYADGMLVPLPEEVSPRTAASVGDSVSDAWRTVGPHLAERPGAPVLILGDVPSAALYAAGIAAAMGASRIDYMDVNPGRVEVARSLGANGLVVESWPHRVDAYDITVSASRNPAALACAMRSTEPGGVCTSIGIFFERLTQIPLLEMYDRGFTFVTGRPNVRAIIPEALALIRSRRFRPELVTRQVVDWEEAPAAIAKHHAKLVVVRGD